MPVYGWNSVVQTVSAGTNQVSFLSANPSRVSLIVSATTAGFVRISNQGIAGTGIWLIVGGGNGNALTFRDFGPMVKDAVYLSHTVAASIVVVATEVYIIRNC